MSISAMLLTATMMAIDASFKAYADAAEQASSQAATRMITHRLLTMIRTSTAHGPLLESSDPDFPVTVSTDDIVTSRHMELVDGNGDIIRIEWRADDQELWMIKNPGAGEQAQPVLGGVTNAQFIGKRYKTGKGLWVLIRGSVDLSVEPNADHTLVIEDAGSTQTIRVVASTKPRKVDGK